MSDVTQVLARIEQGDAHAAEALLPLVYAELRRLATAKIAQESPGQTLQATALVHEAWLRLVDSDQAQPWSSRGHFFAAAAEAMRRILVDNARAKDRLKRGGQHQRCDVPLEALAAAEPGIDILALHDALEILECEQPQKARLVKLRYFAGLTQAEAAATLGVSASTADRDWRYARAWLAQRLRPPESA